MRFEILTCTLVICLLGLIFIFGCRSKEKPQESKNVLPILRNIYDDDPFQELVINTPVCDGVAVFAAEVSRTAEKMLHVEYILRKHIEDQNTTEQDIIAACFDNLAKQLKGNVLERDNAKMISLGEEPDTFAASAIALPNFYEKCKQWLGGSEFIAAAPNPHSLLICSSDSKFREEILNTVKNTGNDFIVDFTPRVFLISENGISIETQGQ